MFEHYESHHHAYGWKKPAGDVVALKFVPHKPFRPNHLVLYAPKLPTQGYVRSIRFGLLDQLLGRRSLELFWRGEHCPLERFYEDSPEGTFDAPVSTAAHANLGEPQLQFEICQPGQTVEIVTEGQYDWLALVGPELTEMPRRSRRHPLTGAPPLDDNPFGVGGSAHGYDELDELDACSTCLAEVGKPHESYCTFKGVHGIASTPRGTRRGIDAVHEAIAKLSCITCLARVGQPHERNCPMQGVHADTGIKRKKR